MDAPAILAIDREAISLPAAKRKSLY